MLGRPRIDVTLRVSGLFRDVFPNLPQLFEAGAAALAGDGEPDDNNPYATLAPRVFGPRPGLYGLAMGAALEDYSAEGRATLGEAWLTGSEWAIDAQATAARIAPRWKRACSPPTALPTCRIWPRATCAGVGLCDA